MNITAITLKLERSLPRMLFISVLILKYTLNHIDSILSGIAPYDKADKGL
jgi:hypothetical protein